jgi:hypothetical protein
MNEIHAAFADQPPDDARGAQPAPTWINDVRRDARILRAARQQGVAQGYQFGSVPTGEQSAQQQKPLVLPPAKIPAQVDEEWAHA